MNAQVNQEQNILLPAATMAVFSKDKTTLGSAEALSQDWRFARVNIEAIEGDVDTAIAHFSNETAASLIIIQTDVIDESFTAKLEELAAHCEEGTSAVVIGPDNDVNLYRRLIDMGVSDYLVKPVDQGVLAEIVSRTLIEKLGVGDSRLVAFMGAKGGAGTSIVAQSVAALAAEQHGMKTIVLDLACGKSSMSLSLGFDPSATLSQVMRAAEAGDEAALDRMIEKISDKLSVVATGNDAMLERAVHSTQIETLLNALLVRYPLVIVDLSQAAESFQKVVLARAQNIFIVAQPILPALRLGRSLIQEIKDARGGQGDGIELIINMQGLAPAHEVGLKDIEEAMEIKPSCVVNFEPKLFMGSEAQSQLVTRDKTASALLEKNLQALVVRLLGDGGAPEQGRPDSSGVIGSLMGKIKGR